MMNSEPQLVEELLAQYRQRVDEIAAREGRKPTWPEDMKLHALRFAAWLSGNPDWWKLGGKDRVNTRRE